VPDPGVLSKPLSDWTAVEVQQLIDERLDEGQRLEYKRELNLGSRSSRVEAAKDFSGMANAQGGLLIVGVIEEEQPDGRRLPTGVAPITDGGLNDQLRDVLLSAVSPPLVLESRQVEIVGGYVLVSRIHQRTGAPHMVSAYDENRYYVRRGTSVVRMTAHEVEQAFAQVVHTETRLGRMLRSVPLVPPIGELSEGSIGDPPVVEPGWFGFVAVPLNAPDPLLTMGLALRSAFTNLAAQRLGGVDLRPTAHGYRSDRIRDGLLTTRLGVYRNGVIEWGDSMGHNVAPETRWPVPSTTVFAGVYQMLRFSAETYTQVGYFGRVQVWITLEQADLTSLAVNPNIVPPFETVTPDSRFEFSVPTSVDEMTSNATVVLRPLMDSLWQAYGWQRCALWDENDDLRVQLSD
jgi:hypothetical protein